MLFGIGFGIIAAPWQGNAGPGVGDKKSHDPKMGLTPLACLALVLILDGVAIAFTKATFTSSAPIAFATMPSSLDLLSSSIKDNQPLSWGGMCLLLEE